LRRAGRCAVLAGDDAMAIVTSTVTVNAAFLQEIKEDNRELAQLLTKAEAECQSATNSPSSAATIDHRLVQVRDQLAFHFALEEAYGYFENAVDAAPRLSGRATALRAQHEALFVEICEIADEAEEMRLGRNGRRRVRTVAHRFLRFCHRLRQHETEETELILQALDDDIGVGD
jgi:hypothetical protein